MQPRIGTWQLCLSMQRMTANTKQPSALPPNVKLIKRTKGEGWRPKDAKAGRKLHNDK